MATIQITAESVPGFLRATRGAAGLTTRGIGAAMIWLEDDDNVRRGEDESSPRADVYTRYSRWCKSNGYQPLASGPFGNRLKGKSFESRAGGRYARYYQGISVMLTPDDWGCGSQPNQTYFAYKRFGESFCTCCACKTLPGEF